MLDWHTIAADILLALSLHTSGVLTCGSPMLCSSINDTTSELCDARVLGKGAERPYLILATLSTSSADSRPMFLALLS